MASKIPESDAKIPVFDRKLSVRPFQVEMITSDGVQAPQEPGGIETGPTHFVRDTLRGLFDASFSKFFNEFLIAHISQAELRP